MALYRARWPFGTPFHPLFSKTGFEALDTILAILKGISYQQHIQWFLPNNNMNPQRHPNPMIQKDKQKSKPARIRALAQLRKSIMLLLKQEKESGQGNLTRMHSQGPPFS